MPPSKLSDLEIQRALGTLPGWARRGGSLVKTYTWPTFSAGIDFVQRVARAAEAVDHHPDMDIRFTKITCTLSSHDAGGITDRDLALAATIEALAQSDSRTG
jgi:4a-hydroxytetrahydrobiopterin dehydratase